MSTSLVTVSAQNWPMFRGPNASGVADGSPTAITWNVATNENVLWKTPVEGVAVSSPVVWGDRVFVSAAISSDPASNIRTGLYGDVEPAKDVSKHVWKLIALDKRTGKVLWDRIAHEGIPRRSGIRSPARRRPRRSPTASALSCRSDPRVVRVRHERQAAVERAISAC
jgi:outer membrane protein assembly factor BamB